MATIERFEDLDVWKRARGLTKMIYDLSELNETETCSRQITRFIQYLENCPNARRVREEQVTYDV